MVKQDGYYCLLWQNDIRDKQNKTKTLEYIQNKILKNQDKHLLWKEMDQRNFVPFSLNMDKLQFGAMEMVST